MDERPPLHDYSRSRAVLIGTSDYTWLPPVAAAANSLQRMAGVLSSDLCGWPRDKISLFSNETGPGDLPDRLITLLEEAHDVALFYFVGHGQIDLDDQLCLGLVGSRKEPHRRAATSLQFHSVRRAMIDSPASTKILILDCCFAGLANQPSNSLGTSDHMLDRIAGTGAYTMTASGAYTAAWFETGQGKPQTYFTKYLADLVEVGIPGQPSGVRLRPLFTRLRENLARDKRPQPLARSVDSADDFIFAYNAAPPEAQVDHEAELRGLRERMAMMEAEAAARTSELARLQAKARNAAYLSADRQEELGIAVQEAGGRLDAATAAKVAAELQYRGAVIAAGDRQSARPGEPDREADRRRWTRSQWIASLIAIVAFFAAAGSVTDLYDRFPSGGTDYAGTGAGQVTVQIRPGDTPRSIAPKLVRLGVINAAGPFIAAADPSAALGLGPPCLYGGCQSVTTTELAPGQVRLHRHMGPAQAYTLLINPNSRILSAATIPPGLRLPQIISILSTTTRFTASAYQAAQRDTSSLGLPSYARGNAEGYLFPGTYQMQPTVTPLGVLQEMVGRFKLEMANVHLAAASRRIHISPADAIIVASLVQEEGARVQDFPKIARVIYNRLSRGMDLQLDSTVFYALGGYQIQASAQQLKVSSPYNTYLHAGLTPGPIDSPGDAAIRAALHPSQGNWLYFVTVNPATGLTKFTNSATQFSRFNAELNHNVAHGD